MAPLLVEQAFEDLAPEADEPRQFDASVMLDPGAQQSQVAYPKQQIQADAREQPQCWLVEPPADAGAQRHAPAEFEQLLAPRRERDAALGGFSRRVVRRREVQTF